jgi:hypothetical protein
MSHPLLAVGTYADNRIVIVYYIELQLSWCTIVKNIDGKDDVMNLPRADLIQVVGLLCRYIRVIPLTIVCKFYDITYRSRLTVQSPISSTSTL